MPFFFLDEKETKNQDDLPTGNFRCALKYTTHLTKNSGSHQIAFATAPAWTRPEPLSPDKRGAQDD